MQSATERQFGIMGEALTRIRDLERPVYDRFPDAEKIVGFRNIIIHGYDIIDPGVLWSIVGGRLNAVKDLVEELIQEASRQGL